MNFFRPTYAEINLANISYNVHQFRRHVNPSARLMAVVKADGYGHGAVEVARAALAAGADWLSVALVEEGIRLRQAGLAAPILILGVVPRESYSALFQYRLTPGVVNRQTLEGLEQEAIRQRKRIGVHAKIDTGMGRLGGVGEEGLVLARRIIRSSWLDLQGVYTHFAAADTADKGFTYSQLDKFNSLVETIKEEKQEIIAHCANSAAAIQVPEAHMDMVRIGISLYGYYPSPDVPHLVRLRPAMTFITQVAHIKEVPKGTPISYGCTFVTSRPSRIATLPVGYADGYWRLLSGKGQVLVQGQKAPLVGRVCMDYSMADITDIDGVEIGEQVVLYGCQGEQEISVDEVAQLVGTINYEITCAVSARVPRIYKYET